MTRKEVDDLLRSVLDLEVFSYEPPAESDWRALETHFDTVFPSEFKYFVELMRQYSFPGEIYTVPQRDEDASTKSGNDTILTIYDSERTLGNWPEHLIPFYGIGNGDFFALDSREKDRSAIYFRSHADGAISHYAESFDVWLKRLPAFLAGSD